ncbi:MAG TPA: glycoside hydrolase family 30 beta sandwich domain-containing protein [Bdellovibrionota bacterium]|jgi:glucosylceramidase
MEETVAEMFFYGRNVCKGLIRQGALALALLLPSFALAEVSVYESMKIGDEIAGLLPRAPLHFRPETPEDSSLPTYSLQPEIRLQGLEGFGANFTESCAINLLRLPEDQRRNVLERIFSKTKGAGFDRIRLPMGASDFADGEKGSYTYDDTEGNEPDPSFRRFSLERDEKSLALLREAQAINPRLTVMITPWSAPAWMKTSGNLHGGRLAPEHFQDFANYFVKTIRELQKRGIALDSLTIQNEPYYQTQGYPTMQMFPEEQIRFIGEYLGPTLAKNRIRLHLYALDHNWDLAKVAKSILTNPVAGRYLHGTAYHCYSGSRWDMNETFQAFPGKPTLQTECTGFDGIHKRELAQDFHWWLDNQSVGAVSMGTSGALGWNLCLDETNGPQNGFKNIGENGGCTSCRGMVKMDFSQSPARLTYNPEFHALAQVSAFIEPGTRRIGLSGEVPAVQAVAFLNADGTRVVVAQNRGQESVKFRVRAEDNQVVVYEIPARAATTLTWKATPAAGKLRAASRAKKNPPAK